MVLGKRLAIDHSMADWLAWAEEVCVVSGTNVNRARVPLQHI